MRFIAHFFSCTIDWFLVHLIKFVECCAARQRGDKHEKKTRRTCVSIKNNAISYKKRDKGETNTRHVCDWVRYKQK